MLVAIIVHEWSAIPLHSSHSVGLQEDTFADVLLHGWQTVAAAAAPHTFGLYSALRACRAISFKSSLQPRSTVATTFCSCGTMPLGCTCRSTSASTGTKALLLGPAPSAPAEAMADGTPDVTGGPAATAAEQAGWQLLLGKGVGGAAVAVARGYRQASSSACKASHRRGMPLRVLQANHHRLK